MSTTRFIVGSIGFLFLGLLAGAFLHKKDLEAMPKKIYPVRVMLNGNIVFDCDSANLNYAWKDGAKIQIRDVYQIRFN